MRYNCWVNVSAEDSELVELLTQLLRVVSPEGTGPGSPAGERPSGRGRPGYRRRPAVGRDGGAAAAAGAVHLEARALIELVAARGISQGQLGTCSAWRRARCLLAAGLERKGWIERGRDEANQRYVRLYLTPEGSRVAAGVAGLAVPAGPDPVRAVRPGAGRPRGRLRGLIRELAAERSPGDLPPAGDLPPE